MKPPNGWKISIGDRPTSLLAEVLNCHQVWSWLTRQQRAALRGADGDGKVAGHIAVRQRLQVHGLIDESDGLTAAGRLVLGWNDEESGPWRERMQELRQEMKSDA